MNQLSHKKQMTKVTKEVAVMFPDVTPHVFLSIYVCTADFGALQNTDVISAAL